MEEKLLSLDGEGARAEDLNAIFRCAHSIKGGGGAFGFQELVGFTHIAEALLDAMREGKVAPSRDVVDALLRSVDVVKEMVGAARDNKPVPPDFGKVLANELLNFAGKGGSSVPTKSARDKSAVTASGEYRVSFKPKKELFSSGNEPLLIIRELQKVGVVRVEADIRALPDISHLAPLDCYLSWVMEIESSKGTAPIKEAFEFVEGECDLEITEIGTEVSAQASATQEVKPAAEKRPDDSAQKVVTSIRVDTDKVDRLVNMVGELVITQAMIQAQVRDLPPERFLKLIQGVEELSQHTRELQESVMSVRMQPVKSIFSRMPRIVRDLSKQLNKDIRIEMTGENTEIDKTVIEQLGDPLTHMIRNSVDHGIEKPEDRKKSGKPEQGVITLSADHRGGRIVIEIGDDGRGINRERVLSKAKEKGLIEANAILSDEEIDHLIFMPGFSTAEQVTNVSGRGVGMDVVRRNIHSLGGTVGLYNTPGKGSRIVVTLPLTLAILDGMIVRVGQEKYIVPINNIIESMKPSAGAVKPVADGGSVINVRGEFIPVIGLYHIFGVKNAVQDPARGLVVLVESGRDKVGLLVDELLGQQQVVIKSIEENSSPVAGISGATILGDGNVSLILDIGGLQKMGAALVHAKTVEHAA